MVSNPQFELHRSYYSSPFISHFYLQQPTFYYLNLPLPQWTVLSIVGRYENQQGHFCPVQYLWVNMQVQIYILSRNQTLTSHLVVV